MICIQDIVFKQTVVYVINRNQDIVFGGDIVFVEFFSIYLRRIIIPEVIYTALITLIVYRLLLALNHKLEKAEQRSVGSFV